jgi:anti-sigma B factor antagonist
MFEIRVLESGTVRLAGRLDAAESERVGAELLAIRSSVRLDCSELDYISSAGIGILIELFKQLQGSGHTMTLIHLLPRVRNIFRYAGLDRLLTIE